MWWRREPFCQVDGAIDIVSDFEDDRNTILFDADLGVSSVAEALARAEVVGSDSVFTFDSG